MIDAKWKYAQCLKCLTRILSASHNEPGIGERELPLSQPMPGSTSHQNPPSIAPTCADCVIMLLNNPDAVGIVVLANTPLGK